MVDLNSTIPFLSPYYSTIEQVVGTISLFVGGILGIYIIGLIIRVVFFQKMIKMNKDIKSQLEDLNKKVDKLGKRKQ